MCTRQSRKVIWDMRNTLFLTLWLSNLLLLPSFSAQRHMSMASPAILSNFSEKQWTQNHPQDFSGLLRALYPTILLKIAVYVRVSICLIFRGNKQWIGVWEFTIPICLSFIPEMRTRLMRFPSLFRASGLQLTVASCYTDRDEWKSFPLPTILSSKFCLWKLCWCSVALESKWPHYH